MHYPVLLGEVIDSLALEPGDTILDATVGGGGHSQEILKKIQPEGRLIALDRDPEAIERVRGRLGGGEAGVTYANRDFRYVEEVLGEAAPDGIDGAVFDLGMSSFQLDDPDRGFSFLKDGPLDMRFDKARGQSAEDVVNGTDRDDLADLIYKFGEERLSRRISAAICVARKDKRIRTTSELAGIIASAVGGRYSRQKLHPAARTFQALRIYVNDELTSVSEGVSGAIRCLRPGARICVISFHSLEDRIIKNIFRDGKRSGELEVMTKKPVTPSPEEIKENIRSRSAKLRVAEKR